MVVSIDNYLSHPNKKLTTHIKGVIDGTVEKTRSKIAEWAAIFHDIGKLNPNFQKKLDSCFCETWKIQVNDEYSHHAYLSALAFLCFCFANQKMLNEEFGMSRDESIVSILTIIAYHHGNLPDFPDILKSEECQAMLNFVKNVDPIPACELLQHFLQHIEFCLQQQKRPSLDTLCHQFPLQLSKKISDHLDFFLETRFSFACLVHADKSDAGNYEKFSTSDTFAQQYLRDIENFLQTLKSTKNIDQLRTQMRIEACDSIQNMLTKEQRIFSLTAPTGAGKTLMLLALAGKIIEHQGPLKIIYALPFLSISEQVENQCLQIFKIIPQDFRRIDSKSDNCEFEITQELLDKDPLSIKKLVQQDFQEITFAYPFILTTFVRVFEALLSNRNATLLKLPNFAKTIFLIDEIQALPPRLYGFFIAVLDAFCRKCDSYAIISTATMPDFRLPKNNKHNLETFFKNYHIPSELLSIDHFQHKIFNRYQVEGISKTMTIDSLADKVSLETQAVLVIVNTIDDSKELYKRLSSIHETLLLNTHFTPEDRSKKIDLAKQWLQQQKHFILISTQLIEAGVDIDFPIVYRDLCPIPSIVQSAGRCNRNGNRAKGKVFVVELKKYNKARAELIYRGRDQYFINFVRKNILGKKFDEPELLELQQKFFNEVQEKTMFAYHTGKRFQNETIDFVESIKKMQFKEIGKFRVIDEHDFGEEYRYYIPTSKDDNNFEILQDLQQQLDEIEFRNFDKRKAKLLQIDQHMRTMAQHIVQIRAKQKDCLPISSEKLLGIVKLQNLKSYSFKTGLVIDAENQII